MPLPAAEEYRGRAQAARERAERQPTGPERATLFRIAAQWDRLAESKTEQECD